MDSERESRRTDLLNFLYNAGTPSPGWNESRFSTAYLGIPHCDGIPRFLVVSARV